MHAKNKGRYRHIYDRAFDAHAPEPIKILKSSGIPEVMDVRTILKSRANPLYLSSISIPPNLEAAKL